MKTIWTVTTLSMSGVGGRMDSDAVPIPKKTQVFTSKILALAWIKGNMEVENVPADTYNRPTANKPDRMFWDCAFIGYELKKADLNPVVVAPTKTDAKKKNLFDRLIVPKVIKKAVVEMRSDDQCHGTGCHPRR